jgi:putative transposase
MHSFNSCLVHFVWSTKDRESLLASELRRSPLAVSRRHRKSEQNESGSWRSCRPRARADVTAADAFSGEGGTASQRKFFEMDSRNVPKMRLFEWQEGYGAFSIGISSVDATVAYIRNQADHHRTRSFREELSTMLRKHGFEFKEEMLD